MFLFFFIYLLTNSKIMIKIEVKMNFYEFAKQNYIC